MTYQKVDYHRYYDLVFRAKYKFLVPCYYIIDFLDYVKAGIAYNTRSYELSSRKISFFVKVYQDLSNKVVSSEVRLALRYFYEDIFYLYQQYFKHIDADTASGVCVCFIPEFKKVDFLCGEMDVDSYSMKTYESSRVDEMMFSIGTPNVYLCDDKQIKFLSIAYDSLKTQNLVEVLYWDE